MKTKIKIAILTTFFSLLSVNILYSPSANARLFFSLDDDGTLSDVFTLDKDNSSTNYIDLLFAGLARLRYDIALAKFIFNAAVDFSNSQIINARFENLATAPTCDGSVPGKIYYNTTTNKAYICNGTTFRQLDNVATAGGDTSTDTSTSVVNEIALFADTTGKLLKRATTSGLLKATSGVLSAAVAGTDYVAPNASITGSTKTKITYDSKGLVTAGADAILASSDFANQGTTTTVLHGNAAGNPSWGPVVEADISLSDVTTGNVSTSAHGFVPKAPNNTSQFLRGDGTWASAATPAGSNKEIQYNNSSAFGADADFSWDATNNTLILSGTDTKIQLSGITDEPSAPSSETLFLYAKNIGGRMMPKWVGPTGLDTPAQPIIGMNKVAWWNPPGNSTTVPGVLGMAALTASGTATARNVATTNILTRMKRLGYVSSATAGSFAGHYQGVEQYTIGDGSSLGGFYLIVRFGVSDASVVTGARMFVGMTNSVAAPTNTNPSSLTNAIGVAELDSSNNLSIVYGGSSAQTPIDLGANFPITNSDAYELILYAPPSSNNTVYYRVQRLGTNYIASGTLTATTPGTELPLSTELLSYRAWRTNNATGSAVGLDICSVYIETDQ